MRRGIRLGLDVGTVRIGVARSDPDGMLAIPVETVRRGDGDVDRIRALALEWDAVALMVGRPIALSGRETASTEDAIGFAARLADELDVPVTLVDERLSTVSAHSALRASGRDQRSSRGVVDQVAAVIILQHALDAARSAEDLARRDSAGPDPAEPDPAEPHPTERDPARPDTRHEGL